MGRRFGSKSPGRLFDLSLSRQRKKKLTAFSTAEEEAVTVTADYEQAIQSHLAEENELGAADGPRCATAQATLLTRLALMG